MPTSGGGTLTPTVPPIPAAPYSRNMPRTLLSIDRFFQIIQYSPILGNQVYLGHHSEDAQPASSCSDPVLQYTWQPRGGGRPGRQEIAQAIETAEDQLHRVLKFPVAPMWLYDEVTIPARPGGWLGRDGLRLRANNFHFIEPGVEAYELIGVESITWSDVDGDGYAEIGTVLLTVVSDFNTSEVCAFFPQMGHDPSWEIRPLHVTLDGTTLIVRFNRHLAVLPELQEQLTATGVDGFQDANFATEISVYRRYNDPSGGATLEWACGGCGACSVCTRSTASACVTAVDYRRSLLSLAPATWDSEAGVWNFECFGWVQAPVTVRLTYRAGYRDNKLSRPMVDVTPELERAITYLALVNMDRMWVTCEQLHNLQQHWRTDLAKRDSSPAGASSFLIARGMLENPFGTTRAAQYAWRVVQPLLVGEAVLNV